MSTMTSTKHSSVAGPTAGARRRRFALQTAVLLLAITFACIFAGVIASSRRARVQVDLTGSSQHRLSERTRSVLRSLEGEYQVVVAGDLRTVDPLGRARTMDVLDAFARTSDKVRLRIIDTSASAGMREFDALLADLAVASKTQIGEQRTAVETSASEAERLASALQPPAQTMLAAREAVKDEDKDAGLLRRVLEDDAARVRLSAENLLAAAKSARAALAKTIGATTVPAIDLAATELGNALAGVSSDLGAVTTRAESLAAAKDILSAAVRDRLAPLGPTLRALRETADTAAERVSRLQVLPIVATARTLEQTSAALVIAPPRAGGAPASMRAIEFAELFPQREVAQNPQGASSPSLDLRSGAEELVATAMVALGPTGDRAPIVVLVHDMQQRLAPGFRDFAGMVSRLRLRGMDVEEWATALDADPPVLRRIDPTGKRPVVYATIASATNTAEGAVRTRRMTDVQNTLVGEGRNVIISMNVSTRPATRDADPLAECLAPLGVAADTGRVILHQFVGPRGRSVVPDHFTTEAVGGDTESGHAIARAVDGLRCHFTWPVALSARADKPAGATFIPLIQIRDSKDSWAESEWLGFAQMTPEDRALLANPPSKDSPRDDGSGEWTVVAAVELKREGAAAPQRAVIVGCVPWFLDAVTQVPMGVVDGRPVARAPGNLELLESSVYWLAGQDELIARSATAESVPLIPNLGEGQVRLIRWALIAGLPLLVLLLGAAWRLTRG